MGLIKSNNLAAATSAATFNYSDIEQQARALIIRAKAHADQILAEATRQANDLRANALKGLEASRARAIEDGKKIGQQQGFAQALPVATAQALKEQTATLTNAIAGLGKVAEQLDAHLHSFEIDAKADLLGLSMEIARRVVKVIAPRDVAVLEANVAEAVRLVVDKSAVRIAIAPSQLEAIRALLPQLQLTWPALKRVDLTEDATITPGGCRIFSANGDIDAQIDRMLERLLSELNAGGEPPVPLPPVEDVEAA